MATYESYKDSGVKWLGQIPSHWEVRSLRNFLRPFSERNHSDKQLLSVTREKGVIVRGAKGEDDNHNVIPEDLSGYKHVLPGDFVINKMKSWQGSYGVSDFEGIVSPAYFTYHLDFDNKRFFSLALRSSAYIPFFMQYSKGIRVVQWDLTPDALKNIPFFLPSPNEQEAIVAYLDKVTGDIDRAIEAQQKMIDALNERKQIIITRAVTRGLNPDAPLRDSGIDWLGKIPEHWEIIPMRYLCKMKTGDKDTIMRDDNGKYPFFVRSPHIEHINTYSYDGEAVLMAGDGVGAGKVFHYVNGKFDYHQRVYNFHQFKRIAGEFLYFYLKCNFRYKIEEGGAKSTVDSVRLPWLKAFPICVMPKDEQQSIVEHIHKSTGPIDCALSNCERMISLLQERKQIIINEVVTGKTKVI